MVFGLEVVDFIINSAVALVNDRVFVVFHFIIIFVTSQIYCTCQCIVETSIVSVILNAAQHAKESIKAKQYINANWAATASTNWQIYVSELL